MTLRRHDLKYSPEPLSSGSDARDTAWAFAALYTHVLQATITRDNLRTVEVPSADWTRRQWIISAFDNLHRPRAFELREGSWLFAAHTVGVRASSTDERLWLTTLRYTYQQWQAHEDDGSWIVRWCYRREDDAGRTIPEHSRAHVHVHADPPSYAGHIYFPKLHIPARRLAIEELVRFLIEECGCDTHSENAGEILDEASRIFAKIQARG